VVQDLWTPPGTVQRETAQLRRVNPDITRDMAFAYNFTFVYKGKTKHFQVVASDNDSRAEIEDMAAECAERWKRELDGKEWKRPPNEDEKKQIGKILNDINVRNQKRAESGRINYKGSH
jgi:hypothetical protein